MTIEINGVKLSFGLSFHFGGARSAVLDKKGRSHESSALSGTQNPDDASFAKFLLTGHDGHQFHPSMVFAAAMLWGFVGMVSDFMYVSYNRSEYHKSLGYEASEAIKKAIIQSPTNITNATISVPIPQRPASLLFDSGDKGGIYSLKIKWEKNVASDTTDNCWNTIMQGVIAIRKDNTPETASGYPFAPFNTNTNFFPSIVCTFK